MDVNDFSAENGADLHDFGAGGGIGANAEEDELTVNVLGVLEVLDFDDVNEFFELLSDLVKDFVVAPDNDGHP